MKTIFRVATLSLILGLSLSVPVPARAQDDILVQGVPLVGSANGMFFDAADALYVANVLGQSISVLDTD